MRVKPGEKRTWIVTLCLALTLLFLPGAAFAVDTYTVSDQCVEQIKLFEGLSLTAYTDTSGNWTIGYGSVCDPADYPGGITGEKAEELLRKDLKIAEDVVNNFLMQYGVSVTQYQFDALLDMTYNLGYQWINPEYRLCSYLINGIDRYTETEVVNAFATWCHAGTQVLEHLVARRMWEAFLFLYGDYGNSSEGLYCYIDYEVNGGAAPDLSSRTAFYLVGLPYGELPVPTKEGQVFEGWFTAEGVQLTGEEPAMESLRVFARWSGSAEPLPLPVEPDPEPEPDYSSWVNPYSDVQDDKWYYTYVRELSYYGVVSGDGDGIFRPDSDIKAGEALKMILVAATGMDPGNSTAGGHWAANYLAMAERLGCLLPGEVQDLDGAIDRAAIARITAIAMGLELKEGVSPFADIGDVYTLALFDAGIMEGDTVDGYRYFNPLDGISRAETCAVVSRVRKYAPANDPALSGYIEYRDKRIPVLWDVPAAPYNKDLLVREGSIMHYYDPYYAPSIGIDVSRHQGDIDWQKVAASGMVDFAFLRVGGRFAQSGGIYDDDNFQKNIAGAQAAGIKVGVYFYSTAVTVEEAVEEANYVLEKVGPYGLQYPVAFDWEVLSDSSRNASLSKQTLTDCAKAFCDTVAAWGCTPMIYVNLNVAYERLDLSRLTDYDLWFAQYNKRNQPDLYYNFRIWQYTDSGTVPGIPEKVDMDIAFVPY